MDVTVAVCTFGGPEWEQLAQERAVPSARALGVPVVHHHDATLHDARNNVLDRIGTEWTCYLDADDQLEAGYFEAMACGTADIRAPAVRYHRPNWDPVRARLPRVAGHDHACVAECLPEGNWLVVGSVVRTELVRKHRWADWPCYEDWDLWLRCWLAGASIEAIPEAVYRAHVRDDSRNRGTDRALRDRTHWAIHASAFQEDPL